jgi:hypothetical protein
VKNPAYHSKIKHIDVQYHFVRDMIEEKKVSLMKVDTLKNVADSLKKSMSTEEFSWCRGSMGISSLDVLICNPVTACMQRKQQVGECWVCVIFFARVVVSKRMCRAHRGVRGGGCRPPLGGCSPLLGGSGAAPLEKKIASGNVTPTSRNVSCI